MDERGNSSGKSPYLSWRVNCVVVDFTGRRGFGRRGSIKETSRVGLWVLDGSRVGIENRDGVGDRERVRRVSTREEL